MFAVAVELAKVPLRPVLLTDEALPCFGPYATFTIVPSGMLEAARLTLNGFVVPGENVMSGDSSEPPGVAGAATPLTAVMERVGACDTLTSPGVDAVGVGLTVPEKLMMFASKRTRPLPP
jgi:hypothetical protein